MWNSTIRVYSNYTNHEWIWMIIDKKKFQILEYVLHLLWNFLSHGPHTLKARKLSSKKREEFSLNTPWKKDAPNRKQKRSGPWIGIFHLFFSFQLLKRLTAGVGSFVIPCTLSKRWKRGRGRRASAASSYKPTICNLLLALCQPFSSSSRCWSWFYFSLFVYEKMRAYLPGISN